MSQDLGACTAAVALALGAAGCGPDLFLNERIAAAPAVEVSGWNVAP